MKEAGTIRNILQVYRYKFFTTLIQEELIWTNIGEEDILPTIIIKISHKAGIGWIIIKQTRLFGNITEFPLAVTRNDIIAV